jgi:hypothetical protein
MNENYERFAKILNLMIQSEVKQVPSSVYDKNDPFVHHLYTAFAIDEDLRDNQIWSNHFLPSITPLVNALVGRDMLEAEALPMLNSLTCARSTLVDTEGPIPIRVVEQYDGCRQKILITLDFKVRHVGNHYRRIINGPLHRAMMPFKDLPVDGREFAYIHNPFRAAYTIPDTCGDDGYELPLPDLDIEAHFPQSKQRYIVRGDYCYYLGEDLI